MLGAGRDFVVGGGCVAATGAAPPIGRVPAGLTRSRRARLSATNTQDYAEQPAASTRGRVRSTSHAVFGTVDNPADTTRCSSVRTGLTRRPGKSLPPAPSAVLR